MLLAGLTVLGVSGMVILCYSLITKQFGKININVNILYILAMSFVFGFIADVLINKSRIFKNLLDLYYNKVTSLGSAALGGLALLFTTGMVVLFFVILNVIKSRFFKND